MQDLGDVHFAIDLGAGIVKVAVRPPLGLESSRTTATITLLDFLDNAAKALLALNDAQRQMLHKMATQTPAGGARPM
jgi:hypothetical protein